jgi:catechol 2,3-dioxygenase-like lactoylglutathione lyase family enzyme
MLVHRRMNHVQHIGLPVTNLRASESFHEKLRFAKVMASGFDYKGGCGSVAMMQRGELLIELYLMPETEPQEVRNRKDGHIDHIAFDVARIDEAFAALKGAAFSVVEDEPALVPFWKNGCKYFNVLGPDGERLEFNQIL